MQIRITPNTDTFYAVLTFLGENYLTNNATKFVEPIMEICHQDLKLCSYATSSPKIMTHSR